MNEKKEREGKKRREEEERETEREEKIEEINSLDLYVRQRMIERTPRDE